MMQMIPFPHSIMNDFVVVLSSREILQPEDDDDLYPLRAGSDGEGAEESTGSMS
jgi:hypothetical protein